MLKGNGTEKLIEYIQTLPDSDRRLIVEKISSQKPARVKKDAGDSFAAMEKFLKKYRGLMPKGFKFDREEANAR